MCQQPKDSLLAQHKPKKLESISNEEKNIWARGKQKELKTVLFWRQYSRFYILYLDLYLYLDGQEQKHFDHRLKSIFMYMLWLPWGDFFCWSALTIDQQLYSDLNPRGLQNGQDGRQLTQKTWLALGSMYRDLSYLMCCILNWIQGENKTSEILRAQRNTSKMKYSKWMVNAVTLFWRKTSDRKRDTPDRNLLLSTLEETTLKWKLDWKC